jgi:hypothetical protein
MESRQRPNERVKNPVFGTFLPFAANHGSRPVLEAAFRYTFSENLWRSMTKRS